jgi:hypothetical protein
MEISYVAQYSGKRGKGKGRGKKVPRQQKD